MIKPDVALEKDFNDNGMFFLSEQKLNEIAKGSERWLSLIVEIAVMSKDVAAPDFSMSIVSKRGVATIVSDWKCVESEDENEPSILSFVVSQRVPDGIDCPSIPSNIAMSFMDLCFYAGNEAVPEGFLPDTFTQLSKDAVATDLGWYLPSRYVDCTIDALGKLNDTVLGGQMEHAILYHNPLDKTSI